MLARCDAVPADWDRLVEQAHSRWQRWSRPPPGVTNGRLALTRIDVVVSVLTQHDLPRWAIDMARGLWSNGTGAPVRLVVYIRHAENMTLQNGPNLHVELLAGKHPKSRNVCTYSAHVARHYNSLADVTLFSKTNRVDPRSLHQALGCATTEFDVISHPWHPWLGNGRRRFIDVICDERWRPHTDLYDLVCPCERSWPHLGKRRGYDDLLVACEREQRATPALRAFVAAEQRLSKPLFPLVHERYAEGIWAVAKSILLQHNRTLWRALNDECDQVGEVDHDTNLNNWALITAQRDPWRRYRYPAWLVSDSVRLYVDDKQGLKRAEYVCT